MSERWFNSDETGLFPNSLIILSSASFKRFFNRTTSCALSGWVLCVLSEIVTQGVFFSVANFSNFCRVVIFYLLVGLVHVALT